jgi:hypothetical protein
LTESLIFSVNDGWCNPISDGIGNHCFGDFYNFMSGDIFKPWTEVKTPYPPLAILYFIPYEFIISNFGVTKLILFVHLLFLLFCVIFPVLHLNLSKRIKKGTEKDGKRSKTTSPKDISTTESVDDIYENIKSVIVYKKKAIQIFNGSNYALSNFASLVKKYKDELGPSVSVFCMAIPIGSDFNLPSAFKKDREKIGIDHLYSVMDPSIKCVKAYEELRKHQKE